MRVEFPGIPENLTPTQRQDLKKLKNLCQDFESFFMREVIKAMRDTVPKNSLLHGGNAEEIYKSMYDDQLATNMAKEGDSGISQALFRQLTNAYLNNAQVGKIHQKEVPE